MSTMAVEKRSLWSSLSAPSSSSPRLLTSPKNIKKLENGHPSPECKWWSNSIQGKENSSTGIDLAATCYGNGWPSDSSFFFGLLYPWRQLECLRWAGMVRMTRIISSWSVWIETHNLGAFDHPKLNCSTETVLNWVQYRPWVMSWQFNKIRSFRQWISVKISKLAKPNSSQVTVFQVVSPSAAAKKLRRSVFDRFLL